VEVNWAPLSDVMTKGALLGKTAQQGAAAVAAIPEVGLESIPGYRHQVQCYSGIQHLSPVSGWITIFRYRTASGIGILFIPVPVSPDAVQSGIWHLKALYEGGERYTLDNGHTWYVL
jgi:hypothetical protein